MTKKKWQFPNTYIIIFSIIIICAITTWVVPGGQYIKDDVTEVQTFHSIESVPQTWQVFSSLYKGFEKQAGIIIFILIIGGSFWIINNTKSVDVGIYSFLDKTKKLEKYAVFRKIGVNNLVMISIMCLFSLFGGVFGMSEESLAFIVIIVPLAISMGYDSITGLCLVYLAAHIGFAGAFLNPFTIGIAQGLAGIPLFSGIEYRFVCWLFLTIVLVIFVLIYAARVKKNPKFSIMYEADSYWRGKINEDVDTVKYYKNKSSIISFILISIIILIFTILYSVDTNIHFGNSYYSVSWLLPIIFLLFIFFSIKTLKKSVHFFIINLLMFAILYLIIGVLCFQWYIPEISGLFLALGISVGISAGYNGNKIAKEFLAGAKDILSAALIVGLAAGIIIILQDGKIIDSILHSVESGMGNSSKISSVGIMYGIQTLINLVIPSATAKAAITIPIMAPFADLINVSRQSTVMAFQFGDGFTNMITPTSGVLIAALGLARIPYAKWVKWIWKYILVLIIIGFLLLIPTVIYSLPGF
ncbi:MAG: YfcC family protein [Bacteroidales bacterium]